MDNDDIGRGRLLGRREAVALLAAGGGALVGGYGFGRLHAWQAPPPGGIPACVVVPESTEGPYFVDRQLQRSDVRTEPSTGAMSAGIPLTLSFNVSQLSGGRCTPLAGAIVDVWQCDARGIYSGVDDRIVGNTVGQKFLRGFQTTDRSGAARFTTIYPGWYSGRTVHIHFKIRTSAAPAGAYEYTSQLYFDEPTNDRVLARPAYAKSGRRTMNAEDMFFTSRLVLPVTESDRGFAGSFDVGLDLSNTDVGRADGFGADGRGRRGGPPPNGGGRGGR